MSAAAVERRRPSMARGELPDLTPERCEYINSETGARCLDDATGRNTEIAPRLWRRYCQQHEDQDEQNQERAREMAADPHDREGYTE